MELMNKLTKAALANDQDKAVMAEALNAVIRMPTQSLRTSALNYGKP